MPESVLTTGSGSCPHKGAVHPPEGPFRVRTGAAVVLTTTACVGGCRRSAGEKLTVSARPLGSAGAPADLAIDAPCGAVKWSSVSSRVRVGGEAVLLARSEGKCAPSETPVTVKSLQDRVKAS